MWMHADESSKSHRGCAANPRLQRTPSASPPSPLSRKPLGGAISLSLVLCLGTLCPKSLAQGLPPRQAPAAGKSDAQVSFGVLKSLAGTWSGSVKTDPPNPELDGSIQVTVRVASGGSVLVHEIAPGGVPEPTMIFLE